MRKDNVAGKVVVITGASSGIGEATARLLSSEGAKVVLASKQAERLKQIAQELETDGGSALAVPTNVTSQTEVQRLVETTLEKYERIDVLINNAGVMSIAPIALAKYAEWDTMIDVNLKGLLYGVGAALPHMVKQKQGHIINLASVAGLKVFAPGGSVYSATKFAVRAFTEGLRMETRADNIRCTLISPGAVNSNLKNGTTDPASAAAVNQLYDAVAVSTSSVAEAISYAISRPSEEEVDEIVLRPQRQDF